MSTSEQVKELIEKVKEYGKKWQYPSLEYNCEGFPDLQVIHKEGNREGGGSHAEIVWYFKDLDAYIRVTGYYESYNGTDWNDDVTQVFPKEKTVTVYEVEAKG